jgi:hypothetical protein
MDCHDDSPVGPLSFSAQILGIGAVKATGLWAYRATSQLPVQEIAIPKCKGFGSLRLKIKPPSPNSIDTPAHATPIFQWLLRDTAHENLECAIEIDAHGKDGAVEIACLAAGAYEAIFQTIRDDSNPRFPVYRDLRHWSADVVHGRQTHVEFDASNTGAIRFEVAEMPDLSIRVEIFDHTTEQAVLPLRRSDKAWATIPLLAQGVYRVKCSWIPHSNMVAVALDDSGRAIIHSPNPTPKRATRAGKANNQDRTVTVERIATVEPGKTTTVLFER